MSVNKNSAANMIAPWRRRLLQLLEEVDEELMRAKGRPQTQREDEPATTTKIEVRAKKEGKPEGEKENAAI